MAGDSLIINADDFGWSRSVNKAVAATYDFGTITSASLMTCGPEVHNAAEIWHDRKEMGLGLHFTLTQAKPVSPADRVPSLCRSSGEFFSRGELIQRIFIGRINPQHVRIELEAQIGLADNLGLLLTHIDGHQHIHVLPRIVNSVLVQAKKRGLAVRIPLEQRLAMNSSTARRGFSKQSVRKAFLRIMCRQASRKATRAGLRLNTAFRSFFGLIPRQDQVSLAAYQRLIDSTPAGVTEIMVHPAMQGGDIALWGGDPDLLQDRRKEAEVLLDQRFKSALNRLPVKLVNYGQV